MYTTNNGFVFSNARDACYMLIRDYIQKSSRKNRAMNIRYEGDVFATMLDTGALSCPSPQIFKDLSESVIRQKKFIQTNQDHRCKTLKIVR